MPPTVENIIEEKDMIADAPHNIGIIDPTVEPTPRPIQTSVLRDIGQIIPLKLKKGQARVLDPFRESGIAA
jgi:hypothetical protein